jgi:hypothetical protein
LLRLKLMSILLFSSFLVIHTQPSPVLGQEPLEQYMKCNQDPYDRLSKECILAVYPGGRFDDVIAKIDCLHNTEVRVFFCRYAWTSSTLEYSCTSHSGEVTLLRPIDIRTNPQRVCTTLCKGCIGGWKRR